MANRTVVKRHLVALREALGDLGRYRASVGREGIDERRDAQRLVEYAVLRALNASLDIAKEWAAPCPEQEQPWYGAGLDEMQQAGLVDAETAERLKRWTNLRRHLARQWRPDPTDVFEVFSTEVLATFADSVEAYLRSAIERLSRGSVLAGIVTRVRDYGAFVDLGGVAGLLHVQEMSRGMLTHPGDILAKGQVVTVLVLAVDPESERVRLRLDPLREDASVDPMLECAVAA